MTALVALGWGGTAAYVVQPGDTLSGIAQRFGVSVAELQRANGIEDADRIFAGASLEVPTPAAAAGYPARLTASPERLALVPAFQRWAAANELPADLLMALTWLESGWQNDVVSAKGAMGIGQLMPDTVTFTREILIGVPSLDPKVPEHNIRMSARYLDWLLARSGGDVTRALAGYYQGHRSVERQGIQPTTARYVADVLALRASFGGPTG
jgi:soluble lytic murein transglycosylase-like protein